MISHFSKLSSQHILSLSLSAFKLLFFPFHLIMLLAFLSFHSLPPLSPTHPLNQSSIHFSFSSPLFHVSNFTFPIYLLHPLVFFHSWPVSALLFPQSFNYSLSSIFLLSFSLHLALLLSFFHLQVYHFFHLSSPPLFFLPLPVYFFLSCFLFTSVFQAPRLFPVLSETIAEGV